jgi:hypothetical protein
MASAEAQTAQNCDWFIANREADLNKKTDFD